MQSSVFALLAAFAASEHGGLALTVTEAGSPTATFSITREAGGPDLVAPYASWFKATGLSGFNVSEPAGTDDVFDPTARDVTYIWDFDDAGYQFAHTPNLPTAWRDPSVAYGKQVAHVFHTHGTFTVSCFAFDSAGNWGTATTEITIADPDVFFAGDKTIFVSAAGVFTEKPTGAQESTSTADAVAKRASLNAAGTPHARIMYRRGETFTSGGLPELHHGSGARTYICGGGDALQPRPIFDGTGGFGVVGRPNNMQQITICDLDMRRGWQADKEIGPIANGTEWITQSCPLLFHRMRFEGQSTNGIGGIGVSTNIILHDVERTNWEFYGFFHQPNSVPNRLAFIGCDIYQHLDALSGNYMEMGNSTNTIGNKQGCYRGEAGQLYFGCCSWLSIGGWSNRNPSTGIDTPPTAQQAIWRLSNSADGERKYWVIDRNVLEGVGFPEGGHNVLLDKLLVVPTSGDFENYSLTASAPGITIRNAYIARLAAIPQQTAALGEISLTSTEAGSGGRQVYNVTVINNALTDQVNASYSAFSVASGTVENNVVRFPARSIGGALEPLGTSALAGFASRWKGVRWNFPAIGGPSFADGIKTVGDFSGGSDVPDGGTITVPYPDYTGYNAGAGFQTNQALCQANSTQFHQVTLRGTSTRYSPSAAGGNGAIEVSFGASDITITNTSGATWAAATQIWIMLDLSDYHMAAKTGTSTFGQTVPVPLPATGSDAILGSRTGLFAHGDFFGTVREDELQTTGIAVTNRVVRQGAFG